MSVTVWIFVLIMAALLFLTSMLIWRLLREKNPLKSALFGIEVTILGALIIIKNDTGNLFLSFIGYALIGTGIILNIFALIKP